MRRLILTSVLTIACSGTALAQGATLADEVPRESAAESAESVYDPFEGVNRGLYSVHDVLDRWILEPVARGYRYVTPNPVRGRVRNFLSNLGAPVTFANDLLQGRPRRAGATAARFGMNSTVGLLGLFDPAQGIGIEPHSEDFGQTLAVWGVAEGPYIFVPLLGPTNLRDGLGNVVDNFLDPLSWATFEGDDEFTLARGVVGGVAMREELLDPIDDIRATSVDPYVRFRSLYSIMRDSEIRNGAPTTEGLLDFDAPPADAGLIAPDTGSNAPIDGAGLPAPPPSPPSPPPTPRVFNGVNPDDDRGAS